MVAADSTLQQIKQKVRRLVMAGDDSVLPDSEIERQINTFVEQIMPFDLRLNNFVDRRVFYTESGEDRYAVNLNEVRQPSGVALASGFEMDWIQDYRAFEAEFPKIFDSITTEGDGSSTYVAEITNVPILKKEVVVSAVLSSGVTQVLEDDGDGDLLDSSTETVLGEVDYTTGDLSFSFSNSVDIGDEILIQYVPISLQRPNTLFFRNAEIVLRPVPDDVYKIEYDAYIVPSALLSDSQNPKVNMWWQYIAFGAARMILEERQDVESLQAILPAFEEHESIIVNQTAAQNNQMRSSTIYYGQVGNSRRYGWWQNGV